MQKDFKPEYDRNGAFLGYKNTGRLLAIVNGTPENLAGLQVKIAGAFATPHLDQVEAWLVELSLIAPRRSDGDGNDLLRLEAYASRLSAYPADVVREALLGRTWRFWPSWFELHEICEELIGHRRAVRDALTQKIEGPAQAARSLPTGRNVVLTEEERAGRQRTISELIKGLNTKVDPLNPKPEERHST